MLKVADAVAKEEAEQKRLAEQAAKEREEKLHDELLTILDDIADLGNISDL